MQQRFQKYFVKLHKYKNLNANVSLIKIRTTHKSIFINIFAYPHLSNNRGGWNKRGGEAKFAKSLNMEAGINGEVGKYL